MSIWENYSISTSLTRVAQIALARDGAVIGVALGVFARCSFSGFSAVSSPLHTFRQTPFLLVSDLLSLLSSGDFGHDDSKLVFVRGIVQVKSPRVLISDKYGEQAVVIDRTQSVPSVLAGSSQSDYVAVNLGGSRHSLPLTMVDVLDEERILPLGEEINALGLCSAKNGVLEIRSCEELPFFLNGNKWKDWRYRRQVRRARRAAISDAGTRLAEDGEPKAVPDQVVCYLPE
ncbi:E3 Ubiquitin ligase MUL1-like [Dillenia turbinata]|uniref:RING-type E3 ubiquitin transferase n=1 Tax=Dillenia turbinata TaxID=194707 RepID=A0AAN8UIQ4_9MAGN